MAIAALWALAVPGAAQAAIEGPSNNFFGTGAGDNTTGVSNSFFGGSAGAANTSGNHNSFFGRDAGLSNTTASANSFVGRSAGRSNTTGFDNAFFGTDAGFSNTTGADNAFFGRSAGQANTNGTSNSFFGHVAGFSNTTGADNAFFGRFAGNSNTTGNFNSFFGRDAGLSNTTGAANAFFGLVAGNSNTTGFDNSFFGREAGLFNTTGARNVFVGQAAGFSTTSENDNTVIGARADTAPGITRAAAIGQRAKVSQSDSLVLGAINGLNGAAADTKVGIGTPSPQAPLHVRSTAATGASGNELLLLDQANTGTVQDRALMLLRNNGGTRFQFDNTATSNSWRFQAGTGNQDNFELAKVGTGEIEMTLGPSGDLEITGGLTQGSDRNAKRDIAPVRGRTVLNELAGLPISEWTYKRDRTDARHLGPMAQDFARAFGLGSDPRTIAPGDMAGVALAGLKAQQRQIERLERQVKRLRAG